MCVLSRTDQTANLIADLWPEHQEELLAAVSSPDIVKKVLAERSELTPSQMVVEAERMEDYKGHRRRPCPRSKLGPVGSYADRIARIFKTEGKEAALRQIEKDQGRRPQAPFRLLRLPGRPGGGTDQGMAVHPRGDGLRRLPRSLRQAAAGGEWGRVRQRPEASAGGLRGSNEVLEKV